MRVRSTLIGSDPFGDTNRSQEITFSGPRDHSDLDSGADSDAETGSDHPATEVFYRDLGKRINVIRSAIEGRNVTE